MLTPVKQIVVGDAVKFSVHTIGVVMEVEDDGIDTVLHMISKRGDHIELSTHESEAFDVYPCKLWAATHCLSDGAAAYLFIVVGNGFIPDLEREKVIADLLHIHFDPETEMMHLAEVTLATPLSDGIIRGNGGEMLPMVFVDSPK